MSVHLRVLSVSEAKSFRSCPRRHHYAYRMRRRPRDKAPALRFGTLFHVGLEAWWQTVDLGAALAVMRAGDADIDLYELAKAEALMIGYHARWKDEPLEVLAVEREFSAPLINPATGAASKTFVVGGKIDAIVRDAMGRIYVVEHKTTSEDLGPGSDYWKRLRLDSQVSTYHSAAQSIGYDSAGCLYDVVGKPTSRPYQATPPEKREYTKPRDKACPECKKKNGTPGPHTVDGLVCADGRIVTDPGGRLYANMREVDETPDEYRARLLEDIKANTTSYFARAEIVRHEQDREDAAYDMWATARAIREAELAVRYPRNVDACVQHGRSCDYWPVCVGDASIDDEERYRTAARTHEELCVVGSEKEKESAA